MSRECCGDESAPTPVEVRRLDHRASSCECGDGPCGCAGDRASDATPPSLGAGSGPGGRTLLALSPAVASVDAPAPAPRGVPSTSETLTVDDACCGPQEVLTGEAADEAHVPWWHDRQVLVPLASGVSLGVAVLVSAFGWDVAGRVLEWVALLLGASTFVPGALRRLWSRRLGVGILMTIAALGAVALGRVGEAAALAFLFSIAEALEDRALDRARRGLRSLLALVPETARVEAPGSTDTVLVPARELRPGHVLLLAAGERAATDGVVLEGRSSLDTSAITGESIPVEVGPGDDVAAGSVNGTGALRLRATAPGNDSSLTTIVRLVEQAQARKGERARLADRMARPLVPAVLALSAAVAVGGLLTDNPGLWLERALVVLVAASPCALAIAVPVTVIAAIGSASRLGVVIRSGEAFEQLGAVRTVAFDKTGTLTRNAPQVVDVRLPQLPEGAPPEPDTARRAHVLAAAAALERSSTHPLAAAVVTAANSTMRELNSAHAPTVSGTIEHPGQGIAGVVDGRRVRVGNPRWLAPGDLQGDADDMAAAGMSLVVVEEEGRIAAVIGIRDELRADAAPAVAELHAAGVRTVMLTGDNAQTARALGQQVGIDDVRAELLPADKAQAVTQLGESRSTAMVGDGINDAPALAAATVGIAMGATGSAAAVEAADVAFTGHDLRLLTRALRHTRRGRAIMTQNIGLALAIIVVLLPLALTGLLSLAEVVLVHELAEVVVIANGLRAAKVKTDPLPPLAESSPHVVAPRERNRGERALGLRREHT